MLDESIPLPSINHPSELRQRSLYCYRWLRYSTEPYSEWYCDGRTLRISHEMDDEIEVYDLAKALQYYEVFPACVEDWSVAIATRLVDESTIAFGDGEREEVQRALADSLAMNPTAVRQLIGTGVIEEGYFGLLNDEGFEEAREDLETE